MRILVLVLPHARHSLYSRYTRPEPLASMVAAGLVVPGEPTRRTLADYYELRRLEVGARAKVGPAFRPFSIWISAPLRDWVLWPAGRAL